MIDELRRRLEINSRSTTPLTSLEVPIQFLELLLDGAEEEVHLRFSDKVVCETEWMEKTTEFTDEVTCLQCLRIALKQSMANVRGGAWN
jgi:hypothetical protein